MKLSIVVAALIAPVALAGPGEAAIKKGKKAAQRTNPAAAAAAATARIGSPSDPYAVWFGGEYVGRDPDPGIRAFMMRNPRIWDGPN